MDEVRGIRVCLQSVPLHGTALKLRASSAHSESEAVEGKGLHVVPASLRSMMRLMAP
jgi:hypothetical protein